MYGLSVVEGAETNSMHFNRPLSCESLREACHCVTYDVIPSLSGKLIPAINFNPKQELRHQFVLSAGHWI